MPASPSHTPAIPTGRVVVIDWMRGLCVLTMVTAHALTFLNPRHDNDPAKRYLDLINGVPGPAFIFVSGFSLALVAARVGDDRERLRRRAGKTLERLGVLMLVSVFLRHALWDAFGDLRKFWWVDILECIALMQLFVLGVMTLLPARTWLRLALIGGTGLLAFVVMPWVAEPRQFGIATPFLNNSWYFNTWPLVPWAGYGWLGAAVGVIVGRSTHANRTLALCCTGLAALSHALTYGLPLYQKIYPADEAWRIGNAADRLFWVTAAVLVLMVLRRLAGRASAWPAAVLNLFSRQSLVAWPVHQVMLYGWWRLHGFKSEIHEHDWPGYFRYGGLTLAITTAACLACDLLGRWRRRERKVTGRGFVVLPASKR